MQVPPVSSIAQIPLQFPDATLKEQVSAANSIFSPTAPNFSQYSSQRQEAASVTSLDREFKIPEIAEGHRILQGYLLYPFHNKAELEYSKVDPFFYNGSNGDPNENVISNLIGTPLGADALEDPRLTFVKSVLALKEHIGHNSLHYDEYLKQLYLFNTDKGQNYYTNQLEQLDTDLANYSRTLRGNNNAKELFPDIRINKSIRVVNRPEKRKYQEVKSEPSEDVSFSNEFGPLGKSNPRSAKFIRAGLFHHAPIVAPTAGAGGGVGGGTVGGVGGGTGIGTALNIAGTALNAAGSALATTGTALRVGGGAAYTAANITGTALRIGGVGAYTALRGLYYVGSGLVNLSKNAYIHGPAGENPALPAPAHDTGPDVTVIPGTVNDARKAIGDQYELGTHPGVPLPDNGTWGIYNRPTRVQVRTAINRLRQRPAPRNNPTITENYHLRRRQPHTTAEIRAVHEELKPVQQSIQEAIINATPGNQSLYQSAQGVHSQIFGGISQTPIKDGGTTILNETTKRLIGTPEEPFNKKKSRKSSTSTQGVVYTPGSRTSSTGRSSLSTTINESDGSQVKLTQKTFPPSSMITPSKSSSTSVNTPGYFDYSNISFATGAETGHKSVRFGTGVSNISSISRGGGTSVSSFNPRGQGSTISSNAFDDLGDLLTDETVRKSQSYSSIGGANLNPDIELERATTKPLRIPTVDLFQNRRPIVKRPPAKVKDALTLSELREKREKRLKKSSALIEEAKEQNRLLQIQANTLLRRVEESPGAAVRRESRNNNY